VDAELAGASLYQGNGFLANAGMPRDRKHDDSTRRRHSQHAIGNCRVEFLEISSALIEVVAVGHPRISSEIVKTGVDAGAQDNPIRRIERSLGPDRPQLRVSRTETENG
jgi:hypothetical protein